MPLIGFQNLLLIFERKINEDEVVIEFDNEFEYKIIQYPFFIEEFNTDCGKLKKTLATSTQKSVLAIALDEQRVIGYMWAHYNFDPLNEIKTNKKSFVVIGPIFVTPSFRGQGISKIMYHMIYKEIYNANYNEILLKTAFDNIPQIKSSIKAGYKIHSVMYKIEGKSYYL
ncbi:GNAT family N-acetyltransferase [Balneolaceae bacterium ANBcel3]|nr:GNAT family N-acetyltransferase [Balneolaceae bacterium ANBcel3]